MNRRKNFFELINFSILFVLIFFWVIDSMLEIITALMNNRLYKIWLDFLSTMVLIMSCWTKIMLEDPAYLWCLFYTKAIHELGRDRLSFEGMFAIWIKIGFKSENCWHSEEFTFKNPAEEEKFHIKNNL